MKNVTLFIPEKLAADITLAAAGRGMTVEQWLANAIENGDSRTAPAIERLASENRLLSHQVDQLSQKLLKARR